MATYPLSTLGPTVDANGISAPPYSDIYQSLQATFQGIYGTDAYIDPDSQDGQLLAIFAKAQSDSNDASIAAFLSFSPATALGAALSNQVKINGIARNVPSNSQVILRVVGQVGSTIINGVATDSLQQRWALPASVTIPPAGYIDVTATATDVGALQAAINTITIIATPQLGWQTVTNPSAASAGAPVESDANLRRRQTVSTALPSQTVLDGILGAVFAVTGVTQVRIYENDTDTVDTNGQPAHSIAVMVIGGDATAIANAILLKKTPGGYTYGSTVIQVTDPKSGILYNIRFTVPTPVPLSIAITIKALTGYTTSVGNQIKQSLADWINGLGIGQRSDIGRLYLPAQFFGAAGSETFEVNVLQQAIKPAVPAAADIDIPFNQIATLAVADVALTVT